MNQIEFLKVILEDIKKELPSLTYNIDYVLHLATIFSNTQLFRSVIRNNSIWIQHFPNNKITNSRTDSGQRKILKVDIADPKSINLIVDYIKSAY